MTQTVKDVWMRALVKHPESLAVLDWQKPMIEDPHFVQVRVQMAGICRTDVWMAQGAWPVSQPLVLGHECVGVVESVGHLVSGLKVGQRVVLNPLLAAKPARFMGRHCHGVFADYFVAPQQQLFPLDSDLPACVAAYFEPVAAALAPVEVILAKLQAGHSVLILGHNRMVQLMQLLLPKWAKSHHALYFADTLASVHSGVDCLIETGLKHHSLNELLAALNPGGELVLRSRHLNLAAKAHVPLDLDQLVAQQLRISGHYYGDFHRALALLSEHQQAILALCGQVFALEQFQQAFDQAQHEQQKLFLSPEY